MSTLAPVASVIDSQTKIHIKGCDVGRTKEMVELIDEAFGGASSVTAPTHEQKYATDPAIRDQARHAAHDEKMAAFTASLPDVPAEPARVDPRLKGAERKKAQQEHDIAAAERNTAQEERKKAIAAEEKRIKPTVDAEAQKAATSDSLSGPMFQRPGTTFLKTAEVQPEIDRLYSHLPEAERKKLAKRLVAPDHGGKDDQQGQKVISVRPLWIIFREPASLAEAKSLYRENFADLHFEPKKMEADRLVGADGTDLNMTFTGTVHPPGNEASPYTYIRTEKVPDEAALLADGKNRTNNPDRYKWRIERKHDKSGQTTLTAVGERVMAYLHHGSLDARPHEHFSQPESNPDFYYKSTAAPAAPVKP